MATITPGTNAALKSVTLENAFVEAVLRCRLYEQDTAKNTQALSNVSSSLDFSTNRLTGSFSFVLIKSIAADGSTLFITQDYFTNAGYVAGTGGTLKSSTSPAVIVEIAELFQVREKDAVKNPTGLNSITSLSYDSETLKVAGTFDFKVDVGIDSTGKLSIAAKPYLLD